MDKNKSSFSQWIQIFLGICGLYLLWWTIQKIGFSVLKENLIRFGFFSTVFLILLYALAQFSFCAAWLFVVNDPEKKLGFWKLFIAYLAGDAVNMTVPSANLAGEPVKILFIKDKIPLQSAIASVTVYKISDFFSLTLFLLLGWGMHFFFFSFPSLWVIGSGMMVLGMISVSAVLYLLQKQGLYHPLGKWVEKIGFGKWLLNKLESAHLIDKDIQSFFKSKGSKFLLSLFFNFLSWFGGVIEILVFTKMAGFEINFVQAITIETFSLFINNIAFFIPARLGVIESGRILIFSTLGFPAVVGLTYGIIRRIRELVWIGWGVVILLTKKQHQQKFQEENPPSA